MGSDTPLKTYGGLVERFLKVVEQSQTIDRDDDKPVATRRFTLGADDSAYLNAGVAMLEVAGANEESPLTSPASYSAETLQSTKKALLSLATVDREAERSRAAARVRSAAKTFRPLVEQYPVLRESLIRANVLETLLKMDELAKDKVQLESNRERIKLLFVELDKMLDPKNSQKKVVEAIEEKDKLFAKSFNRDISGENISLRNTIEELKKNQPLGTSASLRSHLSRVARAAKSLSEGRQVPPLGKRAREYDDDDDFCPLLVEESLDVVRSLDLRASIEEGIEAAPTSGNVKSLLKRGLASVVLRNPLPSTGDQLDSEIQRALASFITDALIQLALFDDLKTVETKLNNLLPSGTASERRGIVWEEMLRDAALAGDRLWSFVRMLSGLLGESADTIFSSMDEAAVRAQSDSQTRRNEIAKQVSEFQSKLLSELAGSLLKNSTLQFATSADDSTDGGALVVVDAEAAKKIKDMASGTSGMPFFEANVALRHLESSSTGKAQPVDKIVSDIAGLGRALHDRLMEQLIPTLSDGVSLTELAHPRNSYCVRLKDDTTAAILEAFDRFSTEFALRGGGRVHLWELIEGADATLSQRFAAFVGHVLIQNRSSTGVNALYASRMQISVNSSQAAVSLQRLINQASAYRSRISAPNWNDADGRFEYFSAAKNAPVGTWAHNSFRGAVPRGPLYRVGESHAISY